MWLDGGLECIIVPQGIGIALSSLVDSLPAGSGWSKLRNQALGKKDMQLVDEGEIREHERPLSVIF